MANRKKAEALILQLCDDLDPTKQNRKIYETLFTSLSNKEFEEWIVRLENDEHKLSLTFPNGSPTELTLDILDRAYKKYDIPLQLPVRYTDSSGIEYETPASFTLLVLPTRRFKQHLQKGLSVAKDSNKRDSLTGQVVRDSRAGAVSSAEVPILVGIKVPHILDEFLSVRGGDPDASREMQQRIINNGDVTLEEIKKFRTGAKSTGTIKSILKAMHIDINL